jgi:hypothetical protein
VKRAVTGSLEHLGSAELLRLVSATSPSGILELRTDRGSLRLEVDRGRVRAPSAAELQRAAGVLAGRGGDFRFQPCAVAALAGEALSLSAFAEAAGAVDHELRLDRLLAAEGADREARPPIHVLPPAPPADPLRDLLAELEAQAPGELHFARIAVIAQDPRPWRGVVQQGWRRRGWETFLEPCSPELALEGFDVLIVHHRDASTRMRQEAAWLDLVRRAAAAEPPVPVLWVAPLGDPDWVHRLIEAGVAFLMPAPAGDAGKTLARFAADLSRVVERQLQVPSTRPEPGLPAAVSELVGALLSASDPDQGLRSLLVLASESFARGALLAVTGTEIRCRAGFGYPLNRSLAALPRGIALLERVIRSGEAVLELAPRTAGALQLAAACGVSELPAATALIPLGGGEGVVGVLVADRNGDELPELAELVVLAGRLGGVALG